MGCTCNSNETHKYPKQKDYKSENYVSDQKVKNDKKVIKANSISKIVLKIRRESKKTTTIITRKQ